MKFVVGIGNPGKTYEKTRHNIGFEILDTLGKQLQPSIRWTEDKNLQSEIKVHKDMVLLKPKVFVNNTGDAVFALLRKYGAQPKNVLVVCDDVNLKFAKLRLREHGSAGGHHGLESIIEHLGSDEFPRLRIGVGNDSMPEDLTSFVLGKFDKYEKKKLGNILEQAVSVCEAWINEGFESARNELSRIQSVKEKGE